MWFWQVMRDNLEILILSATPVIELRGAIPVGLAQGMSLPAAFALAYAGSLLPSLPILYLYTMVSRWMQNHPPADRIVIWVNERLLRRQDSIDRWGLLALFIFVAIPLPGTGVWSASGIAALLHMPKRTAFVAIALGNLTAGLIITAVSFPLWR